ncbi:hypothetical protein BDW75DRAFT_235588 [Aspergillus navahoensis]
MRILCSDVLLVTMVLCAKAAMAQDLGGGLPVGGGDGGDPLGTVQGVLGGATGGGSPIGGDTLGGVNDLLKQLGLANLDLDSLLHLDWKNSKDVLNLGGEQGKAKIELLAKQKGKPNATDEEKAQMVKEEFTKSPKGKAVFKAKQDKEDGRLNFFYAYGMQSVGDIVKTKWVLIFDNASTANRYFGLVKKTYAEYYKGNRHKCKEDPAPQIFIFPHGVGPDGLEKTREFTDFAGKIFITSIDEKAQLPVIPHQDAFGYLPSRWSP